ncbi:MAG: hypothetical protein JJD98_05745 [Polaromonas sp.]|nr:hypothetical protein [Polaromonas sp.]
MTTTKVTVSGGFHNAGEIAILVKDGKLSTGQYKRLTNHFCGIKECVCGGVGRADVDGMPRRDFMEMVENASFYAYAR